MGDAFLCKICHKFYNSKAELDSHKDAEHRKKHVCPLCTRSFNLENKLRRHFSSVHSNERPFVCNLCSKGFSRKDKLNDHIRRHNKAMKFSCNFCDSMFAMRSHLSNHLRTVHQATLIKSSNTVMTNSENSPQSSVYDSPIESTPLFNQDNLKILISSGVSLGQNPTNQFCDNVSDQNIHYSFSSSHLYPQNINSNQFECLSLKEFNQSNDLVTMKNGETGILNLNSYREQESFGPTQCKSLDLSNHDSSSWLNSLYYLAGNAFHQRQQMRQDEFTTSCQDSNLKFFQNNFQQIHKIKKEDNPSLFYCQPIHMTTDEISSKIESIHYPETEGKENFNPVQKQHLLTSNLQQSSFQNVPFDVNTLNMGYTDFNQDAQLNQKLPNQSKFDNFPLIKLENFA